MESDNETDALGPEDGDSEGENGSEVIQVQADGTPTRRGFHLPYKL